MAGSPAVHAGTKRPHSDSVNAHTPHKKRRLVRKGVKYEQVRPADLDPASQDPIFAQGQLLKSISAALAIAGFDSVKPTALEMFRGAVEEYMFQFLDSVRFSMATNRRVRPTALDFASALALIPNTSSASLVAPQLDLILPKSISAPSIPDPDPAPPPAPDFSALLRPLLIIPPHPYIPRHFPPLPPKHSWRRTPVYPTRERDARQMREKATEEGILAEQALRKLAAAAKAGAIKAERRREIALSGIRRKMHGKKSRKGGLGDASGEDLFKDMLKEVGEVGDREEMGLSMDGVDEMRGEGVDVGMPEGVLVNWGMSGWRRGGKKSLKF